MVGRMSVGLHWDHDGIKSRPVVAPVSRRAKPPVAALWKKKPPVMPNSSSPTRDELASRYLDQLPYEPYRVQEEALLAWFSAEQGVLVCTPTGTGKTLIAEAALFEALHTGATAYYTTPLIALTEQKFREMQSAAVKWGFHPEDVGLVTGNRRENPDARVLVVVAEILLNRLLHSGRTGQVRFADARAWRAVASSAQLCFAPDDAERREPCRSHAERGNE